MKNKFVILSYGRYTSVDTWTEIKDTPCDSVVYVNSGWARVFYGNKEYILKEGYAYFISQFKECGLIEHMNFDHTYYNFHSYLPFKSNNVIQADTKYDKNIYHLFEYGNSLVGHNISITKANFDTVRCFITLVTEYFSENYNIPVIKNEYVLSAIKIISNEYNDIKIDELAKMLNINKDYFSRLFKKETGITPQKHIQMQRLLAGREMLKKGVSVLETSIKCGYSSPVSFSFAYKQQFGYPPSNIKKF